MAMNPEHRELTFGLAGVTACTSGIFYKHFPIAELITPIMTRAECEVYYSDPDMFPGPRRVQHRSDTWFGVFIDQIQHLAGQEMPTSVVVAADPQLGLMVEGFHPAQEGAAVQISVEEAGPKKGAIVSDEGVEQDANDKKLVIHNWRWNADMPFEVLLFLPGFNNACQYGTGVFSQFLALGDFPPQVKPLLFSWPSGQILTYYKARKAASSPEVAQSFTELVAMLIQVGLLGVEGRDAASAQRSRGGAGE